MCFNFIGLKEQLQAMKHRVSSKRLSIKSAGSTSSTLSDQFTSLKMMNEHDKREIKSMEQKRTKLSSSPISFESIK